MGEERMENKGFFFFFSVSHITVPFFLHFPHSLPLSLAEDRLEEQHPR